MKKRCAFCWSKKFDELEPFRYVEGVNHDTQGWILHPYIFCSAACTRRYVRKFHFLNPKILQFTEMYLRQVRGVTHSFVAPDTVTLASCTINGQLTHKQFRDTETSQCYVENTKHLHIDKRVFIGKKQQINCEERKEAPLQQLELIDYLSTEGRYSRNADTIQEDEIMDNEESEAEDLGT